MNKFLTLRFLTILFFGLSIFSACKKDNLDVLPPELMVTGDPDTITLGQVLTLQPKIKDRQNFVFKWTVNGEQKSTDSIFAFEPESNGDFEVQFSATSTGGIVTALYNIHVYGKYENGFFLVNEGWFGHGTGTLSFYRYDTETLEDSVFLKENPGKTLEPTSSTLEYGALFNGKLYLVSKVGGPLVALDAFSLKETARIPAVGGNDWRAFVGIDESRALVTSGDGVYPLTLSDLSIGSKIDGITGQIADAIKAGKYVFILSASEGVLVLDASDYSVVKKIPDMQVAFARTPDGSVWAAGGNSLVKINSSTLEVETVTVPFSVYGSWGAWHPGSITASTKENVIYLAQNGTWSGGTKVYKYEDGDDKSFVDPFITLPTGQELYGAGLSYNPELNQVIVTTVQSGYGENYSYNFLYFHDAASGLQRKVETYRGYYFPALPVCH